jgi:Bifunctional DNA primase/polymerase, N-terminal
MASPLPVDRPTVEDRIRAATWFAERGFGVFPVWSTKADGTCRCPRGRECTSPGKHPIPSTGFKDATTDVGRITTFLSAKSEPNVGLVPPEDVFVLDVDGDDIRKLADLEERLGPLPQTLRTKTANGWHIFLRWPRDMPRPQGKLFGMVVRWKDTGYVIGPRSVHASGAVYTPAGTTEIVELPPNWGAPAARRNGDGNPTIKIKGDELPGIGGRHDWLRDRARWYRGMIDDPDVLRATMLAENARLDQPKTEEEVDRAIGEVFTRFAPDPPAEVEERVARRLGEEELGLVGPAPLAAFPVEPEEAAYRGILGEMVADISPGTDASLVGILGSLVAFCGALVPGQAYFHRTQTTSPFIALVGESTFGSKGTAMTRARDAMTEALDVTFVNRVVLDGLNSGEGLVSALAYKRKEYPYEPTVGLVYEEEYANLLASRGREGSTLDPKMRVAFDGGVISNRRSEKTTTVNPPYWLPALVGITPSELKARLEPGALQSGSANRWLYLPVMKRDVVPTNEPPVFSPAVREQVVAARRWALQTERKLLVESEVTLLMTRYRDWLPTTATGVAADLTRRLPIITFRIALTHAVMERSEWVTIEHLERALALVEYARRSIVWVFGTTVLSPAADTVLRYLREFGPMRRTTLTREYLRDPIKRQAVIDELIGFELARIVTEKPEGRGGTVYWLEATPIATDFTTDFQRSEHDFHDSRDSRSPRPSPFVSESGNRSGSDLKGLGNRSEIDGNRLEIDGIKWKEVEGEEESETIVCSNYHEHQTRHFHTPQGWVCPVCSPVH